MQIIGLNRSVHSSSASTLSAMTMGRVMPWVRCVVNGGVQDPSVNWVIPAAGGGTRAPTYRELVILDHKNEYLRSFDLESQPIDGPSRATQRAVVREALRAAAALPDTDEDHLPDAWEMDEFGSLTVVAADTTTGSGLTALQACAQGISPHVLSDSGGLEISRQDDGLLLTYIRSLSRRPALQWTIERSGNLSSWLVWPDPMGETRVHLYDGSGTERVSHLLPIGSPISEFFRLKFELSP